MSELLKAKECIEELIKQLGSRQDLLFSQRSAVAKAQRTTKRIEEILNVSPTETGKTTVGRNEIWLTHDKTQICIYDTKTKEATSVEADDISKFIAFVAKLEIIEISGE